MLSLICLLGVDMIGEGASMLFLNVMYVTKGISSCAFNVNVCPFAQ